MVQLRPDGSLDLSPVERFRVGLAVATLVFGAVLVGLAVVADMLWEWQNILPSVFLEVGVALGLVAVLAFLERRLVLTVASATEPAYCTLADPPSRIRRDQPFGAPDVYACDHENPIHRRDVDTGDRLEDHYARRK